jgi:uncharacterized repeat protein (TIGR02543 family)
MSRYKRYISIFLVIVFMVSFSFNSLKVNASTLVKISFQDKNLEQCIREKINKYSGDILKTDAENITSLDLNNRNIKSLDGLQNFVNLGYLNLDYNPICDITPLKGLTELTYLSIGYGNVYDITTLSNLTKLCNLNLSSNNIQDISVLKNLIQLQELYLGDNKKLSDIRPLSKLVNLSHLNLCNDNIIDIKPICNLTNLTELSLSGNKIKELTPLERLVNLSSLSLDSNNITDISPLKYLKNLKNLGLENNKIINISFLSNMTNLDTFVASENQISDISVIKNFNRLTTLWLKKNKIVDISSLANKHNLQFLILDDNIINDMKPLSGLTSLNNLSLINCNLTSVEALQGLVNLKNLELSSNKLTENGIQSLKKLKKLNVLNLEGNPITSISQFINSGNFDDLSDFTIFGLTSYFTDRRFKVLEDKYSHIISTIIKPDMTDLEKVLAIHDYVELNLVGSFDGSISILDGMAICTSYSGVTRYLLSRAGVECETIGGSGHAWNVVKIDGDYYHLDTTFDDQLNGKFNYDYFNLSDEEINKLRSGPMFDTPIANKTLPCNSTKFDFVRTMLNSYSYRRECIQVLGGYIYYIDDNFNLYKESIDGNTKTKLVSDTVKNIFKIESNYIYYVSQSDGDLYKTDINGKNIALANELVMVSSEPTNNANSVLVTQPITINFNKPIKENDGINFIMLKDSTGKSVEITKTIIKNSLKIIPKSKLKLTEEYSLYIPKAAVEDFEGNTTSNDINLYFSTEKSKGGPIVLQTSPLNRKNNVSINTKQISVKFNENISFSSTGSNDILLKDSDGYSVNDISIYPKGDTLYVYFNSYGQNQLRYNEEYTLTILAKTIRSKDNGISLRNDIIIKFKTSNLCTVRFNSRVGSTVIKQSVIFNSSVIKPKDPTKKGYTFGGWFKDEGYINAWNFRTDKVTSDTILYAKWIANPCITKVVEALPSSYNSINIRWGRFNGVSGASGYEIYSATSSTGGYRFIKTTTNLYYSNTGLTAGRTYYYKIRAYKTVGNIKAYSNWTKVVYVKL